VDEKKPARRPVFPIRRLITSMQLEQQQPKLRQQQPKQPKRQPKQPKQQRQQQLGWRLEQQRQQQERLEQQLEQQRCQQLGSSSSSWFLLSCCKQSVQRPAEQRSAGIFS
jgi:hypothetical protein